MQSGITSAQCFPFMAQNIPAHCTTVDTNKNEMNRALGHFCAHTG